LKKVIETAINLKQKTIDDDILFLKKSNNLSNNQYLKETIEELMTFYEKDITRNFYQKKYEELLNKINTKKTIHFINSKVAAAVLIVLALIVCYFVFRFLHNLHFLLGYAFIVFLIIALGPELFSDAASLISKERRRLRKQKSNK